ncbi:hypothetical protein pb186bvf_002546 [Paramecium bursaria]
MGSKNTKEASKGQASKPNPQPKQQRRAQPQQAQENTWMYDLILQYLASPLWRNPISDFLDENCVVFDEEEENKFSYQDIHKKFKSMIEAMIEQLMTDIGVEDEQQLYQVIEQGLKNKKHRKYFEQLLIVDNFLVFKKLMLKRNKELEYEALKELQKQEGGNDADMQHKIKKVELDKERMEIEHAMAMSIAVEQEKKKLNIDEDQEFMEALRQSEILYQQEQASKSQFVPPKVDDPPQQPQQPQPVQQQKPEQPIKAQTGQLQQPKVDDGLVAFEDDMAEEVQKPIQQIQTQARTLPQIKKELPKIQQQPDNQLARDREALQAQRDKLLKEKQEMDEKQEQMMKENQQKETLEDRKKRLQEQRELIKKKKQQEREVELQKYNQDQQNPQQQQLQQQEVPENDSNNPLAIDMAEFVAKQQKAQDLQLKKEELRKKHELMKKIKQNVDGDQ